MYINVKKILKTIGLLLSLGILAFGVISYGISLSVQQQIVGVLTAVFGLQLTWLILWVTKEK